MNTGIHRITSSLHETPLKLLPGLFAKKFGKQVQNIPPRKVFKPCWDDKECLQNRENVQPSHMCVCQYYKPWPLTWTETTTTSMDMSVSLDFILYGCQRNVTDTSFLSRMHTLDELSTGIGRMSTGYTILKTCFKTLMNTWVFALLFIHFGVF